MAIVNPFAGDPEREPAWEKGFLDGFAEPEAEHFPPLESELFKVFQQGEQTGRDERRSEPSSATPLPSSETEEFSRFEIAADGVLIPIPDEVPSGNRIRDDARVQVSPQNGSAWYYVVIYNGRTDVPEFHADTEHFITELFTESALHQLEVLLAKSALIASEKIITYGSFGIGVALSVFHSAPILKESRFRGYLKDGTPVAYVVLDPVTM